MTKPVALPSGPCGAADVRSARQPVPAYVAHEYLGGSLTVPPDDVRRGRRAARYREVLVRRELHAERCHPGQYGGFRRRCSHWSAPRPTSRSRETMCDLAGGVPFRRDVFRRGLVRDTPSDLRRSVDGLTLVADDRDLAADAAFPVTVGETRLRPEQYEPLQHLLAAGPSRCARSARTRPSPTAISPTCSPSPDSGRRPVCGADTWCAGESSGDRVSRRNERDAHRLSSSRPIA